MYHQSKSFSIPGGGRLKKIKNFLLILLIFYTTTSLFKFSLAQWVYWGPPVSTTREHCALIGALFQSVHSIGATSLFLFLWLRQHSLQQGSKYLTQPSQNIIRFSWGLFGTIILAGISATIGVIISNTADLFLYIRQTNACSYAEPTGLNSIIVYVGYTLVVTMQGCILFLFILVLQRSRQDRAKFLKNSISSDFASRERIFMLIRNCTIAAAVSSTSNVTVVLLDIFAKGNMAQLVVDAVWDIDNAVSLGSIVFCFSNWKELLLPWPCLGEKFKLSFSSSGTTSAAAAAGTAT